MMTASSTPRLDPETRIEWNPDHLSAEIDGQVVVMSLSQGKYVGLNDTATAIWRRLQRPLSVSELVGELVRDFEGDPAEIRQHALDLLVHLHALGLIDVKAAAASG